MIDKNNPYTYVLCPLCGNKFGNLNNHLIRLHNICNLQEFKAEYGLKSLSSQRISDHQSIFMTENNNSIGGRSEITKEKISLNRTGKGIGTCGSYIRTDEIKSKISKGVAQKHKEGAYHPNKYGCKGYFFSKKMKKEIHYESSWERRLIECFDLWKKIDEFYYEPVIIPYYFLGATKHYIPDFHVKHDDGIHTIWEVKRQDHLDHDPIVKEKICALKDYCNKISYNVQICTLKDIENIEKFLKNCPKDQLNEY
jgi:hypothetical protein